MKWLRLIVVMVIATLVVSAAVRAQSSDLGVPDTLDMVFSVIPDSSTNQLKVQVDFYLFNDSNQVIGGAVGFSWSNPNLLMDSAVVVPLIDSVFDLGVFLFEDGDINVTNANRRFHLAAATLFSPGLPPDPVRRKWASFYFTLSQWNACDTIGFDTLTFNSASIYKFVSTGNFDYFPVWAGKQTIRDTACDQPSNLVVTPDSLHFVGVAGASAPPAQSFLVASDFNPLSFTISEDAGWLQASPLVGTTDQTIAVTVNTTSLLQGGYIDTISVSSAQADNSPQTVVVTLEVQPPPPTIATSPSVLFFNAIAGEANPAPRTVTITNIGGSTLNWSVSNSELWLTPSPSFGIDSGDVSIAVNISGLGFGEYDDTLFVSDPTATNDPVAVPIHLSIGSDLPLIEVDSPFNTIIVPFPSATIDPKYIHVRNGGQGTMTYSFVQSSPRISNIWPDTGTAPDSSIVNFRPQGGWAFDGANYYDTVWVHSNEAINSPLPVVFWFHYVSDPKELGVSRDTLSIDLFRCDQGAGLPLPADTFVVFNSGGDGPLEYVNNYESDFFTVSPEAGRAPRNITVTAKDLQSYALGTYLDTIIVTAFAALNSPETVFVKVNVIDGIETPQIVLNTDSLIVPTQENEGPIPPLAEFVNKLIIFNKFGGCMPWTLLEDIPYMNPDKTSGDVEGLVFPGFDASGIAMGQYFDTFQVAAASASNSPVDVIIHLKVWRFRGDFNYSGEINIVDLTYFVAYSFGGGPAPQPEYRVGDLNCDKVITIDDLTYMVNYMFAGGPIPCMNPY